MTPARNDNETSYDDEEDKVEAEEEEAQEPCFTKERVAKMPTSPTMIGG